ncbi:hypothetical protein MMC20_008135 [Loxospora ochrophaea]|nr:hypothetical protein [Loxospora ochrophaea]
MPGLLQVLSDTFDARQVDIQSETAGDIGAGCAGATSIYSSRDFATGWIDKTWGVRARRPSNPDVFISAVESESPSLLSLACEDCREDNEDSQDIHEKRRGGRIKKPPTPDHPKPSKPEPSEGSEPAKSDAPNSIISNLPTP